MAEYALGQILIQSQLIDQNTLSRALYQQKKSFTQSGWQLLGEILVESGDICRRDLEAALDRQSKVLDIKLFTLHYHASVHSRLKRLVDLLGAVAGLIVFLGLLTPISLAILLNSPGPIVVAQYRVGLRGKQFKTWKFRTAVLQHQRFQATVRQSRNIDDGLVLRPTRVGKFLRKTHLDKLPQFFNVFKGDMSLVGPRPPTLDEIKDYSTEDWLRLSIKPGMTGPWQTRKKTVSTDSNKRFKLDMAYIRRWHLSLDLKIIIYTIWQALFGFQIGKYRTSFAQDKVMILNLPIDNLSKRQFLKQLNQGIVFTANVDHLMKLQHDQEFCQAYSQANFRTCDSQILVYASQFLGQPIKERLSGSDLFPAFCRFHKNNDSIKIFLLGGMDNAAQRAQVKINQSLGRQIIVGSHSPSFGVVDKPQECLEIINKINQHQATVLAVCLGAPNQEKWIYRYRDQLPSVKIFLALGATVDFEAGNQKRAPRWISNLGFEWMYRLLSEPKRLWKRYLIHDTAFFWLLFKQKLGIYYPPFSIHNHREYPFTSTTLDKRI